MKKIIEGVVIFIFERVPVLNFLNGNKRLIGNVLMIIGAGLEGLRSAYPGMALLPDVVAYYSIVVGAITRVVGDMHAQAKDNKFGSL